MRGRWCTAHSEILVAVDLAEARTSRLPRRGSHLFDFDATKLSSSEASEIVCHASSERLTSPPT